MGIVEHNADWVEERSKCSLVHVFHQLLLGVSNDVEQRGAIRKQAQGDSAQVFFFQAQGDLFSASRHEGKQPGRLRLLSIKNGRIVVTNEKNQEVVSASVGLNDEMRRVLVAEDRELDEWQFRKRALETLFFD